MKAVANTILAALLISIFMLTFTNFIMLFPWYLTLVYETMNLSTDVATVNGITVDMLENVTNDLKDKPLFKRKMSDLKVLIDDEDVTDIVFTEQVMLRKQRGESIRVGIRAVFPFDLRLFGVTYSYEQEIMFDLTTTGVRYYKDMPYDKLTGESVGPVTEESD